MDPFFDTVFEFGHGSTTVVWSFRADKNPTTWELSSDEGWRNWLSDGHIPPPSTTDNGMLVVLAGRASQNIGATRQASINRLPFSPSVSQELVERLFIQHSIARVVSRSDVACFETEEVRLQTSGLDSGDGEPAIVYRCRSSNGRENDLALTATHFFKSGFTYAVVYGCTEETKHSLLHHLNRVSSEDPAQVTHPMLLPAIFAALERNRLNLLVKDITEKLEEKLMELSSCNEHPTGQASDITELYLDTKYLQGAVNGWKLRVDEMVSHLDELGEGQLPEFLDGDAAATRRTTGRNLKRRLRTMIHEYHDDSWSCQMRVDGVSIINNLKIAHWTKEDGEVSRKLTASTKNLTAISILFLPIMIMATVFSTQFFNWFPKDGEQVVSPYIWVMVVSGIGLTMICLGLYFMTRCVWGSRKPGRSSMA